MFVVFSALGLENSQMAELYVIGSVSGGSDFDETSRLYCKWKCVVDKNNSNTDHPAHWMHVGGRVEGTTQQATLQYDRMLVWSHPIDIHYAFTSTVGWPRFYCEVWHVDDYDRHRLKGYGMCILPTTPGVHSVECVTWKPAKGAHQSIFEGLVPSRLEFAEGEDILLGQDKRQGQWGLTTGSVHLDINILCRGLNGKSLEL